MPLHGEGFSAAIAIANGAHDSGAVLLSNLRPVGIITPAAWTAAAITFRVSADGGATFQSLRNLDGSEFSIASGNVPTSESVAIPLDPTLFAAWDAVIVRSGTDQAAVNQGAARALTFIARQAVVR